MSTEKIHRFHRNSRNKLVWCIQRRFIGYTGLVVINKSGVYRDDIIGYTGLVVKGKSGVCREDS